MFLLCSVEECSLWVSTEMSSPVSGMSRLVSSLWGHVWRWLGYSAPAGLNIRSRMRKFVIKPHRTACDASHGQVFRVLFKHHRMEKYTWWLYKNAQQLIFTCNDWDASTKVDSYLTEDLTKTILSGWHVVRCSVWSLSQEWTNSLPLDLWGCKALSE